MIIYGINAVVEALKTERIRSVRVSRRGGGRLDEIVRLAAAKGVTIERVDPEALDRVTRGSRHQGIAAELRTFEPLAVPDLLRSAQGAPLLVVLDGIEDPHNVGAILRTVDAAAASGVIVQTRRAASLDGAAAKVSAGAVAHVGVAHVVNLARALEELKEAGVWVVGLAAEAPMRYDEADLTLPTALVVGSEGQGLRRLVRDRCDLLVSIPMLGHVDSLNVSVAAGVALFEAVRQRRAPGRA